MLTPILLLGYTPTDCAEELSRYGLTQTVYDLEVPEPFRRRPGGREAAAHPREGGHRYVPSGLAV